MVKIEIKDVYCSDWHWVYVDGFVVNELGEGHQLTCKNLMNIINDRLSDFDESDYMFSSHIDFKEIEISDDYVEECGGRLPSSFCDIPPVAGVIHSTYQGSDKK